MNKPFHLIAEIGVNHEGSIDQAKKMILAAKQAGCSSVKLQAYKAENLATPYANAYWDDSEEVTQHQFELFKKYDGFEVEDYIELSTFSKSLDIKFGLSIFDLNWVDDLYPYVDFFKVASADLTFVPMLQKLSNLDKLVIISTGASTIKEIQSSLSIIGNPGGNPPVLLHCTLCYPTKLVDANLDFISQLRRVFPNNPVGLSDHISDNNPLRFGIARALGIEYLEKHFTYDKNLPGNDHYHAGDQCDFEKISELVHLTDLVLGEGIEVLPSELPARMGARRSIVYSTDLSAGTEIKMPHLAFKRPGTGLSPSVYAEILGRTLSHHVKRDDQLRLSDFE